LYPYVKIRVPMMTKSANEFKLSTNVGFTGIPLVSRYFFFLYPYTSLYMLVKYAQYNTKTYLLEVDFNNKLYLSF
jgi:hypothetical protein